MLKVRIALLTFVVLMSGQLFAECWKCSTGSGCLTCETTYYNGGGTCTLLANGEFCYLQEVCEGPLGEECQEAACVENRIEFRRDDPREWQLVSVTIRREQRTPRKAS